MNKNNKLLLGIGALAILYFVFRKKGTTTKSTSTNSSKVEGGTISVDEKEILDSVKSKTTPQAGDSPKVVAIKKFFAEITTNPPKSEQDFLARASKAGLSKADLQTPEAQKIMNPFQNFVGDDGSKRRESLRRKYGLSLEDDKKLSRVIKITNSLLNRDGITNPQEREARIDAALKASAKNQNLNLRAFYLVEAEMESSRNQPLRRKKSFAGFMDFDGFPDVQANIM